eukprot:12569-Heterococcus_DN1.PRE.3
MDTVLVFCSTAVSPLKVSLAQQCYSHAYYISAGCNYTVHLFEVLHCTHASMTMCMLCIQECNPTRVSIAIAAHAVAS